MYFGWWFNSMKKNYFSSCGKHELILHMNLYSMNSVWIHIFFALLIYEFIWIWIHIMYEFIYFLQLSCMNLYIFYSMNSYYVWIHILFAVIMYEFIYFLQCKIKAASTREPRARSASREGEARAHLLPRPGRARLPRPLGLRAAAPIVRVACGCPDS
jgi:hypothetical protein